ERGIKRSMLHLEKIVGGMFDRIGDSVSVRRADDQGSQDQQIERSLEDVTLKWRASSFGHDRRDYTPEDDRVEQDNLTLLFTLDRGYLRWVSALFQKIIDQNKCISRTLKQNKNPARR